MIGPGLLNSGLLGQSPFGSAVAKRGLAAPDAPTDLTATQVNANVLLEWTDNATNETGYKIYRSDGVTYALLDTIAADSVVYTDVAPGNGDWWYEVAAYNAAGETLSDAATVTLANLLFTADQATITPAITLSGGAPAADWLVTETGGGTFEYTTAGFTHNRVTAGPMTVELRNSPAIKSFVTLINFNGDGITSSFHDLHVDQFTALTILRIFENSFTGDLSGWSPKSPLTELRIYTNSLTGDLSGWTFPASLMGLFIFGNSFTGDLSGWTLPAAMTYAWVYGNAFSVGPPLPASSAMTDYRIEGNAMLQASVNATLLGIYTNSPTRTATGGTINVGTTNQAPSGTFQAAASCPVTAATPGKEIAHELINDTCDAFANHWSTVTITA
jgi:hypothetical protein